MPEGVDTDGKIRHMYGTQNVFEMKVLKNVFYAKILSHTQ